MTTDADQATDAMTPALRQRRARMSLRLIVLMAALFAMLTVLGGGAGMAIGKIASAGAAGHEHNQYTSYQEHRHGPGPFGDGDG